MLVLGESDAGQGCPDGNGYLLGMDADHRRMILKKRSYVVITSRVPEPLRGIEDIEFFKTGNTFSLFLNGKRSFGYFDYDPIQRGDTFPTLYLRTGWSCAVVSIEAFKRAGKNPQDKIDLIVQTRQPDSKHFLIIPFTSSTLSAAFQGIHGFYLQDIAKMQNQMVTLKKQYQTLLKEDENLKIELEKLKKGEQQFIGTSKSIMRIKEQVERVAGTKSTLLIQGPTGTGKEVLAKFIHSKSLFNEGPFLKVDCSILPKELMESELFGHEKGSFTGAIGQKVGLLEQADNGTVFLDEVNNLTLETQAKLLQFLQDFKITRVGGKNPIALNTRIIVASNVNLKEKIAQGTFREDLYYRIAVITIDLPPLNQRLEDIPALCEHFLKILNSNFNKIIKGISPQAYKKLLEYHWPGNVRELKNVLEQAVVFCDSDQIGPGNLRLLAREHRSAGGEERKNPRKKFVAVDISKEKLLDAFKRNRGVIKNLAEELGVSRFTLYYHFKKLGINPNKLRDNPRRDG
jgi:transcriptional regulator with PAS, ATPase and Fis domain